MKRKIGVAIALICWLLFDLAQSRAANYPEKPITIVVTLAPGGVADILARAIGQRLTEEWGQPVIVENRAAGNTQVGAAYVAKSPPDGYTLLLTPEYTFTVNPFLYKQHQQTVSGLIPITGLAAVPLALVVNTKMPAQEVKTLISWARANPAKLNYGAPGIGSVSHLGMEMFQARAGVKFNAIGYRGAAPAIGDLIAGHIDAMLIAIGLVSGPANAGQLRLLGVGSSVRLRQFPDVPTIAETLPEFEAMIWFGLFAPKETAPEIVTKLNNSIQHILADTRFQKDYMVPNSFEQIAGPPSSLSLIIERDSARWSQVIRDAAIVAPE